MKKLLEKSCSLLLVLIFLFNYTPVFAESTVEHKSDIQFRGISFGTTFEDVLSQLNEEGYMFDIISTSDTELNIFLNEKGYPIRPALAEGPRAALFTHSSSASASYRALPEIELTDADVSIANLGNVHTYYYFVSPDKNNISTLNSVLYTGLYSKRLTNSSFDEYSYTSKNILTLLEHLYGKPTNTENTILYKTTQGQKFSWIINDVDITFDVHINWTDFENALGTLYVFITYEWKEMLPKVEYYKNESEKEKAKASEDSIVSKYGTDGL